MTESIISPPPEQWHGPQGVYSLSPSGREAWSVTLDGTSLGTLIDLAGTSANRWTIRVEGNEVAGVGSAWPTWEIALLELAEFRETLAS